MDDDLDIAIVGLACRFPGARNAEEFWRNLAAGVESITPLSDDDILQSGAPKSHLTAPNYVKAAPVLDDPGAFDAAFFGFTPNEARTMDPQHRILLELAHEALEDAGCDTKRYPGRVGVFAGAAMNTYFMHAGLNRNFAEDYIPTLIFNDKDFLSTRLSYKLDLKGPSITVQTACSTSLVAVHLARQSLLSEESDIALAGAVSVRVPHRAGYFSDAGGVTSPDGHVRAFDAQANGTVFGSGGGIIVMKRLRDALADGDTIRAIIKGSAINNDGAEKAGYTAPSVNSQADAVIEALANADVDADSIGYIETHGSGTPVGDPIEIRALAKAFRASTQRSGFCAIGSVKTNIGHLDAAAGMAGLIKTVLALQHRQIPASLNYSRPNPEIDFAATPFFVNTRLAEWKAGGPRRAGIMATGMGGTNAHVVLEEAQPVAPVPETRRPNLLVLSARTESALAASAEKLRAFLEGNPAVNLDDAAFTLQSGRRAMQHRRFVVAADRAATIAALAEKPARLSIARADEGAERPVVLLLPGVGDHYVGMGRELCANFPVFRSEVDRCAEILLPHLGCDIRDILWPKHRDWQKSVTSQGLDLRKMLAGNTQPPEDDDSRRLNQTALLQPALFTIEYALARLWSDLGVVPQAIAGHSMGEYVGACLAGVFSLDDALRLIVRRTQLVESLSPGSMLAVTLPEAELHALLPGALSLALINGPSLCIVAGPPEAVAEFSRTLTARGVIFRPVQNTHAFHSRLMDPIVGAFEAEVRKVRLSRPRLPFVSNVTGRWISDAEATDPAYWARHLNHTARFNDALRTVWQMDAPLLLEAGPGKTLGVLANQHPGKQSTEAPLAISSLRHHYDNQSDSEVLLNAIGRLWLAGAEIRWEKLPADRPRRKVPLPTYPFERQNFWIQPETHSPTSEPSTKAVAPGFSDIDQWFYVPSWERTIFPGDFQRPADAQGVVWLIISRSEGHVASLGKCLEATGASVRFACLGQRFEHRADGSFEIDPASPDDYLRLFREIQSQRPAEIRVVHLGCIAAANDCHDQDLGFFSLLFIAQAIGGLNISISVTVGIISSQIHEVTGNEALKPQMATVLGACSVIPKEFPNITCFNVDLPDEQALSDLPCDLSLKILSEFNKPVCGEVIAFRGPHRWRRKFDQVPLAGKGLSSIPGRLRPRGVYLITGGTGGIGLAIAKYLAKTCQARLVLTKQSAFPAKAKWGDLAKAEGTPDSSAKIIRQLLELEHAGSEVDVFAAEVSDRDAMQRVFAETLLRHGAIHGIIHAAGIVQDGLILGKIREIAERVMAPKVRGCDVVYQLSKEAGSDFLALFSSTASVLGPAGQIDYSAANAYLDAFSHFAYRESGGPHMLAINWPGWREVGILAEMVPAPGMQKWKEDALSKAISTEDGLEAFRRALDSNLPQIIVSPTGLDSAIRESGMPADARFSKIDPLKGASSTPKGSPGTLQPPLRPDQLRDCVVAVWQQVLGFDQVGPDESFFELGGHSLLLIQVHRELCRRLDRQISLLSLFQNPTPRTLAQHLSDGTPSSPVAEKARLRAERQRQANTARNPRT
jgi:acyl transferase domain-containing protein